MADLILTKQSNLLTEDVITRAVQFFTTAKWRPTTQSARAATFEGMPPIPWFMMLCTVIGFICCVVPGFILYFMVIKKLRRFQNIVVTASPKDGGTEVVVTYPSHAKKLARDFLAAIPGSAP